MIVRHRSPKSIGLRTKANHPVVMQSKKAKTAALEMSDRPRRRTFTVQTKLRVLSETDGAADVGGIGAILRREGLYSSTLMYWRRQRESGALSVLTPVKRGPKPAVLNPLTAELVRATRENARLVRRLEHAEAIITTNGSDHGRPAKPSAHRGRLRTPACRRISSRGRMEGAHDRRGHD
jgi:transposase